MAQFNLKQIEAFVTVADFGTFRRAAERLNTSQPNISNRISQLEHHLGEVLMERDAGSVRLTHKGAALLGQARAVLAAVDQFQQASGKAALFDSVLRLGVSEMVAQTWLRAFVTEIKARYPMMDLELTVDLSANLSDALFARDLDFVLQSGPFDRNARGTVELGQSRYFWVASPQLGLGDAGVTAAQIAEHTVLTHARSTLPFQQIQQHFEALKVPVRLVPSTNIWAVLNMAIDGLGIACLPAPSVQAAIGQGKLVRLNYDWQPDDLVFAARWIVDPTPSYFFDAAEIAQRVYPAEAP